MKKFKIILSTILLSIACVCMASGGFSYGTRQVFANVNEDGSWDLGKYHDKSQQAETETYSTLTTTNLYVDGDESATQALYTVRATNIASVDARPYFGGSLSFGSAISLKLITSTSASNRMPWLSHSFKISDNLLQASKNGYLDVSVRVNSQINNENDLMRSVLYNGTLSGVVDIDYKSFDMETIAQSTTAVDQTLSLSNVDYSDFLILFAMNRGDGGLRTVKMTINQPTLIISSKDTTAPIVEFCADTNWSGGEKILTIKVTDNESGVLNATGNGLALVSESADDKTKTYQMPMPENGSYSVTVTDNVGNTHTYTYTETHIDKTTPNGVTINMPELSHFREVMVNATFVSDNQSPEKIYYTLDGSTPTKASSVLNIGDNLITFPSFGEFALKALVIDEVGLVGEMTEKNITLIPRRTLSISATKCTFSVTKPTTFDDDEGCQFYDGETIRLDFTASENCSRKVIRINSEEFELTDDYYEFVTSGDTSVEIIYVTNLSLLNCTTTYVYNPDITEVIPTFNLSVDNLNIVTSITLDGVVTTPKNVGIYTLNWSYSDYEYAGAGSFNFEITPLDIYISVKENQFKIYGESNPAEYEYSVRGFPDSEELSLTLSRENGENVGTYSINLVETNLSNNYSVHFESQNFTIKTKKIVVIADCVSKTYGDNDPALTYKLYDSTLVSGDTLNGELTRTAGEDVGSYSITKGTLNNSNYEILYLGGTLQILPKEIDIEIDDITTTYGTVRDLTFTTLEPVDPEQITGALLRTEGNNVGVYSISLGTLSSTNYKINVVKLGSYTITPKLITVTALATDKVYGDTDNLQYAVDGLLSGDDLSGELARNAGENVGRYEINVGSLRHENYTINFVPNYLNITPASLVVNIEDATQVYREMSVDFQYSISGLKFDDQITCELYREAGENVGEYTINCREINSPNYVVSQVNTGVYSITKATIIPVISKVNYTYSGSVNYASSDFPFELNYVYKVDGIECDGMLNAGTYQVQAFFVGNENYNESKSAIVDIVVEKQKVYLTLADNKFIYDGTVKFPEYYYDTTCGLDPNKIIPEFESGVSPMEVGSYNFQIITTDSNYEINASGVLLIASSFAITNENNSIIECPDATFDENCQDIVLVEEKIKGEFNDKSIISSCTFANVAEDNNHIYTVRIKATSDAESVYVYQLGANNSVREIVVTNEDGYYVFKVDNLTDTYLITKDIEPMPIWFWLAIVGGVVLSLILTLQIIKHNKKVKLAKVADADIETYNIN